jgi:hypothetical protein
MSNVSLRQNGQYYVQRKEILEAVVAVPDKRRGLERWWWVVGGGRRRKVAPQWEPIWPINALSSPRTQFGAPAGCRDLRRSRAPEGAGSRLISGPDVPKIPTSTKLITRGKFANYPTPLNLPSRPHSFRRRFLCDRHIIPDTSLQTFFAFLHFRCKAYLPSYCGPAHDRSEIYGGAGGLKLPFFPDRWLALQRRNEEPLTKGLITHPTARW